MRFVLRRRSVHKLKRKKHCPQRVSLTPVWIRLSEILDIPPLGEFPMVDTNDSGCGAGSGGQRFKASCDEPWRRQLSITDRQQAALDLFTELVESATDKAGIFDVRVFRHSNGTTASGFYCATSDVVNSVVMMAKWLRWSLRACWSCLRVSCWTELRRGENRYWKRVSSIVCSKICFAIRSFTLWLPPRRPRAPEGVNSKNLMRLFPSHGKLNPFLRTRRPPKWCL